MSRTEQDLKDALAMLEPGVGARDQIEAFARQVASQRSRPIRPFGRLRRLAPVAALRQAGYTVLAASRGSEALRLAQEHIGPINLLVTDRVMPGMSGKELAAAFVRVRGHVPVLFVTGGGEEDTARKDELGTATLVKPFTTDALLNRIRSMLDQPRT